MNNVHNNRVQAGQTLPASPELLERIERRWETLPQRLNAKLLALRSIDRKPEERFVDQAARAGTASKRLMWLRKAADHLNRSASPQAACRKGCSHCCHIAVMISRAEAQVIAKETGAVLNNSAGSISISITNAEDEHGGAHARTHEVYGRPCSFLSDGGCLIYGSRPLQCRLLLNLDDDALLCQLVEGRDINVPYLNANTHHAASVSILGAHQDYDDIRSWFPRGLSVWTAVRAPEQP